MSPVLATATFSDFQVAAVDFGPVTVVNPAYAAGVFSAGFQTVNGASYRILYQDTLNTGAWNTLTTITGDGAVMTFTDSGPAPGGQRVYQVASP